MLDNDFKGSCMCKAKYEITMAELNGYMVKHCVLTIVLTDDTSWSCVFGHLHDIISIQ